MVYRVQSLATCCTRQCLGKGSGHYQSVKYLFEHVDFFCGSLEDFRKIQKLDNSVLKVIVSLPLFILYLYWAGYEGMLDKYLTVWVSCIFRPRPQLGHFSSIISVVSGKAICWYALLFSLFLSLRVFLGMNVFFSYIFSHFKVWWDGQEKIKLLVQSCVIVLSPPAHSLSGDALT